MGAEPILSYRDLDVWNVAIELSAMTYEVAALLPKSEMFGLGAQMRRAGVSVSSNVAEGHAYGTPARCVHHIRIALGSLGELDTQFEVALRLKFVTETDLARVRPQLTRTRQLLHGLLRAKRIQVAKGTATLALLLAPAVGLLFMALG